MESAELKSGSLLKGGEYRIVKPLGQGGFGITYLAEQVSLGRKVAVKEFFMKDTCEREGSTSHVTVPTASNRELVAKFKNKFIREARMIASFDNPHIVKIIDVFEENGTAYYVMEYLPGGSLSDRVKKMGKLSENEALDVIRKVADALSYIHSRNVLHMDIKPSNVMLSSNGEPVLVDFGISKHYDEAGHQTSSTPVGISKGYAPLEQYTTGDVSSFTPATDIYSLGATMYYLLTGEIPPDASYVMRKGVDMPQEVSLRMKNAVHSAMRPVLEDRPQSIGEFLKILDGKTEGQSGDDEDTEPVGGKDKKKDKKDPEKNPDSPLKPKRSLWIAIAAAAVAAILCVWLIPKFISDGDDVPVVIDDADTETVAENVPDKNPEPVKTQSQSQTSGQQPVVQPSEPVRSSARPATGAINGHEYVDLGLPSGLLWATRNVGASSPSDYGGYYAWGETSTKSSYDYKNVKYYLGENSSNCSMFSKYCTDSRYGTVDNRTRLELSDDAARANWGGSWRMPTNAEWVELKNNCTWTWTSQGGHNGYRVTCKNGNSIFLPAAGWRIGYSLNRAGERGDYWSSSLSADKSYFAYFCCFGSSNVSPSCRYDRFNGRSVRPVSSSIQ